MTTQDESNRQAQPAATADDHTGTVEAPGPPQPTPSDREPTRWSGRILRTGRARALAAGGVVTVLAIAAVTAYFTLNSRYSGPPQRLAGMVCMAISVAFSPDGRTVATTGTTVQLWDVASGQRTADLDGHTDYVQSVAFSPDGRTLASGSLDNTAGLWDLATRERTHVLIGPQLPPATSILSVAFSPDSKSLATGSIDGTVRLWNVATGSSRTTFRGLTTEVTSVAFSPDGKSLATGGDLGTVRLWNVATGQGAVISATHRDVHSVAFSPDGKTLAIGSDDSTVQLWDVTAGRPGVTLGGLSSGVNSVAFSPNGKTLATGSKDRTVELWSVATGQRTGTIMISDASKVHSVAFDPNGETLAIASGASLELWRVAT